MRNTLLISMSALLLLTSCGTYTGTGAYAGATFGSIIGSAVGGLAGGYRGHNVGTLVGLASGVAVGAAIGSAMDNAEQQKYERYYEERQRRRTEGNRSYEDSRNDQDNRSYQDNSGYDARNGGDDRLYGLDENLSPNGTRATIGSAGNTSAGNTAAAGTPSTISIDRLSSATGTLEIRNPRILDASRDGVLTRGEEARMVFEVFNVSSQPVYQVQPSVMEVSGNKHIHVSENILVESIAPGKGIRYTAVIKADNRLKDGIALIRIGVLHNNKPINSQTREFTLQTAKR